MFRTMTPRAYVRRALAKAPRTPFYDDLRAQQAELDKACKALSRVRALIRHQRAAP